MKRVIIFFLLWLALINIFAWLAFNRIYITEPDKSQYYQGESFPRPPKVDFLKMHARWDSDWYIELANSGYTYSFDKTIQSNANFFPLYPLVMRTIGGGIRKIFSFPIDLYKSYVLAGILISVLSLLVAVVFLFKLISLDFEEEIAFRAIVFLLIFPAAFFLVSVYSESLFLAVSVLSFYLARKRKWFLSAFFGAFATLTRPVGILLIFPHLIEFLKQKKKSKNYLFLGNLFLMPLALFLFSYYFYKQFGDPLAYIHAQEAHGRISFLETFTNPLVLIKSFFSQFSFALDFTSASAANILFEIFFTFWSLILSLKLLKIRASYAVYCLLTILMTISGGVFASQARYLLVLFPIFILPAIWGQKNEIFRYLYLFSSVFLLALNIILFVNGYWAG